MSADRLLPRVRTIVVAAALTASLAIAAPAPAAHAGSPWCLVGVTMPFGDVVCNTVVSGSKVASKVISFAEDPMGYLQQHITSANDSMLSSLLSETTKS